MKISYGLLGVLVCGVALFSCEKNAKQSSAQNNQALFEYQGKAFEIKDLPDGVRQEIYKVQSNYHSNLVRIVDQYLANKYIEQEAKKSGKSTAEVKEDLLGVNEPTEAELKKFYEEKKDRIPYPFNVVKKELAKIMKEDRSVGGQNLMIQKAKESGGFKFLVPPPEAPVMSLNTEGRPVKDNPDAKITVVEFADFRCPHCGHAFNDLKGVHKKYGDKIRFVFMDYPLQENGPSFSIARGGYCAQQQNKFWEYHDEAYTNQATLNENSPKDLAKKIGLDLNKFTTCIGAKDSENAINASREEGERVGVNSTPTFYVNGKKVVADDGLSLLQAEIERQL